MNNRVYVYLASGSGGAGRTAIGMASGMSGMKCRFWNNNTGPSGADNTIGPVDYLTITSVTQDIVSAVSVTGKLYSDYAFATSIAHNDTVLVASGGAWPTGTLCYPFK